MLHHEPVQVVLLCVTPGPTVARQTAPDILSTRGHTAKPKIYHQPEVSI
jgi:hypothetical protein